MIKLIMLKLRIVAAVLSITITWAQRGTAAAECPTWYTPSNNIASNSSTETGEPDCECGAKLDGVISCSENYTVKLATLHCMTHDAETGTVEGYCPYGHVNTINSVFNLQPQDPSCLTRYTCGFYNRTGVLCSHCEDELGVAVLSYNFECVKCLGKFRGWLLYLTLALVPLTVFFVAVILCNIDVTTPHMNSLLCIMQILIFSLNTNPQTFLQTGKATGRYLAVAAWTIVGFWNLDIFRYIYPSFCITQGISIFQAISLEYIIAFYPILLIVTVYIVIELHDSDYRVVKTPCLFLRRLLNRFKRNWCCQLHLQTKTSVIKYFSTFLLLAYTKVLFVSFNLVAFTQIYKSDGSHLNRGDYYVFYNASVRYLSSEHLPYFILASITLTVFNIFPLLLLLLYPLKTFQKCLTCCKFVRWHPLHAFADKFQGYYKDGTCKSRDYRYFAGFYLLIRVCYHLRVVWNNKYSMFVTQIIPLTAAVSFGVLRPYKNDLYNRLDCGLFTLLTFGQICLSTNKYIARIPITLLYILAIIPITYLLSLMLYKLFVLCAPRTTEKLMGKLKAKLLKHSLLFSSDLETGNSHNELLVEYESDDGHVWSPMRGIMSMLSRFSSPKESSKKTKTTYSTFEISQSGN